MASRKNQEEETTLVSKMKLLAEMRKAVASGLSDLAKTVRTSTPAELSSVSRSQLQALLHEMAAEQDKDAIVRIIDACVDPITAFGRIENEVAAGVMRAFSGQTVKAKDLLSVPPESDPSLTSAPKETKLAIFLIECVKTDPTGYGASTIINSLIEAKVKTDTFIITTLKSDIGFKTKMEAVLLCSEIPNVSPDTLDLLVKKTLENSHHGLPDGKSIPTLFSLVSSLPREEARLTDTIASHLECEYAANLVELVPATFDRACALVLKSGSPRALASFYRSHGKKCDKKAFHEKLAEAMRPDPDAMAMAILEGRHGGFGYHPMHPFMMMEIMGHPGFYRGR